MGFADVILRGRVTGLGVALDERVGSPYTYVAVDVTEVLKGAVPERHVTIKQLGGRIGSTALEIAGQPTFTTGERESQNAAGTISVGMPNSPQPSILIDRPPTAKPHAQTPSSSAPSRSLA